MTLGLRCQEHLSSVHKNGQNVDSFCILAVAISVFFFSSDGRTQNIHLVTSWSFECRKRATHKTVTDVQCLCVSVFFSRLELAHHMNTSFQLGSEIDFGGDFQSMQFVVVIIINASRWNKTYEVTCSVHVAINKNKTRCSFPKGFLIELYHKRDISNNNSNLILIQLFKQCAKQLFIHLSIYSMPHFHFPGNFWFFFCFLLFVCSKAFVFNLMLDNTKRHSNRRVS